MDIFHIDKGLLKGVDVEIGTPQSWVLVRVRKGQRTNAGFHVLRRTAPVGLSGDKVFGV